MAQSKVTPTGPEVTKPSEPVATTVDTKAPISAQTVAPPGGPAVVNESTPAQEEKKADPNAKLAKKSEQTPDTTATVAPDPYAGAIVLAKPQPEPTLKEKVGEAPKVEIPKAEAPKVSVADVYSKLKSNTPGAPSKEEIKEAKSAYNRYAVENAPDKLRAAEAAKEGKTIDQFMSTPGGQAYWERVNHDFAKVTEDFRNFRDRGVSYKAEGAKPAEPTAGQSPQPQRPRSTSEAPSQSKAEAPQERRQAKARPQSVREQPILIRRESSMSSHVASPRPPVRSRTNAQDEKIRVVFGIDPKAILDAIAKAAQQAQQPRANMGYNAEKKGFFDKLVDFIKEKLLGKKEASVTQPSPTIIIIEANRSLVIATIKDMQEKIGKALIQLPGADISRAIRASSSASSSRMGATPPSPQTPTKRGGGVISVSGKSVIPDDPPLEPAKPKSNVLAIEAPKKDTPRLK